MSRPYSGSALSAYHRKQNAESRAREAARQEFAAKFESERPRHIARLKEIRAALVRHHSAKRRVARLRRTAAWADQSAIRAIYERARALSIETGVPHHVDHEIPLQGRLVSGLHVEANLQILTGSENSRKRNHFEIGP